MNSSDIIKSSVAEMDDQIRKVISDENENIIAYPYELSIWSYGINEGYWNMLWPDRPLPETFDDVLDAWIEWERDYAAEYPGVGFIDEDFDYAHWVYSFVSDYVMQHDVDGLPDLTAPALRSVLEKLHQVYEIRRAKGRSTSWNEPDAQIAVDLETGPGCIFKKCILPAMTDLNETGISTADDYLYGVLKNRITPLPIVFDEMTAPPDKRAHVRLCNQPLFKAY